MPMVELETTSKFRLSEFCLNFRTIFSKCCMHSVLIGFDGFEGVAGAKGASPLPLADMHLVHMKVHLGPLDLIAHIL